MRSSLFIIAGGTSIFDIAYMLFLVDGINMVLAPCYEGVYGENVCCSCYALAFGNTLFYRASRIGTWQVVYGLPAIFDIILFRLICKIFCCKKIIYKMIDTKYDTTYNIDRRYSECQSGINY